MHRSCYTKTISSNVLYGGGASYHPPHISPSLDSIVANRYLGCKSRQSASQRQQWELETKRKRNCPLGFQSPLPLLSHTSFSSILFRFVICFVPAAAFASAPLRHHSPSELVEDLCSFARHSSRNCVARTSAANRIPRAGTPRRESVINKKRKETESASSRPPPPGRTDRQRRRSPIAQTNSKERKDRQARTDT